MVLETKDEFDQSLLLALRAKDVNSVELYLSTIDDPGVYLHRLYEQPKQQSCTLLMMACLNQDEDMIRMLLDRFHPNLEILNNIVLSDAELNEQIFHDVTVVWTAAANNHFDIVKLLVEYGANIDQTTRSNSTALRCACYHGNVEMARYLIEKGANPHIAKLNNDTNLMVSANKKHLSMVRYLVEELRCDVNQCDMDGRSALHDAVNSGSLELVTFLLEHGAHNFPAIRDQMSPLMWAAERRRSDLLDAFTPHSSLIEYIEGRELLASALIIRSDDTNFHEAFKYLSRSIDLRISNTLPKRLRSTTTDVIFDHRQECQTIDQLKEIRFNSDQMFVEALLIRERLLGPSNSEYRFSLRYYGTMLARRKEFCRGFNFWIYELDICRRHQILVESTYISRIISLLCSMLAKSISISIEHLLTMLKLLHTQFEQDETKTDLNLYHLLYLITISSKLLEREVIDTNDVSQIYRQIHNINRRQYMTMYWRKSLLHLSVDSETRSNDFYINRVCKYPCVLTTQLLLKCGADVHAVDSIGNTPLHTFVFSRLIFDATMLKLLCQAGAHLDSVNTLGETPADLASNTEMKQTLQNRMKLSLKCCCARIIRKKNISFDDLIPMSLARFVEKH